MKRYAELDGYTITGCYIRTHNIMAFTALKIEEGRESESEHYTRVFYYYPDDPPEEQWGHRGLQHTRGLVGCACFKPEERWVFVNRDAGVYVAGHGAKTFEAPIHTHYPYIANVRCIAGGHAYAVQHNRGVYRRDAPSQWTKLENGLFPDGVKQVLKVGFMDIDGFTEQDIYACGRSADLWHYDGTLWTPCTLPEELHDNVLEFIVCGGDGLVYMGTNWRTLVRGRGQAWEVIHQSATDTVFESMAWYDGYLYVATASALYRLVGDDLERVGYGPGDDLQYTFGWLAAGDGILLSAGIRDASLYDGKRWQTVIPFKGD